MLSLHVENIADISIVECEGRIVRSEAALKLREVVTSQRNARTSRAGSVGSERHRSWRSGHALVLATMGQRARHSAQAVQPHQLCAREAAAGQFDAAVRHRYA